MNNALLTKDAPEVEEDKAPIYREKAEQLGSIIEALQNIAGSSYWKVLQQFVFDVDLNRAKSRLVNESNTTEIFRLQGEIRWGEKFSLESLIEKYRNELTAIRKQL